MSAQTQPKPQASHWTVAIIVAMAAFLEAMDGSVANVAVPHIAGNLSSTMSQATWVLTSYIVANAVVLPLSGWLSALFGRKRYFLGSVILFTAASVLCGLAPNLPALVIFRILQGLFGGGLLTASQAIIADAFPAKDLGKGMAVYGIATIVAPVVGPVIGGIITDNYSWRWIFLINLPIGVIAAFLIGKYIFDPPDFKRIGKSSGNFDYIGISTLTVGIAAIQCVLDRGQEVDWFASPFITVASIIGVICLLFAIIWELKIKNPVVEFSLLKNVNASLACMLVFIIGIVLYGTAALLPMLMQDMLGYSATLAGWVLAPGAVATMIAMPVVGILVAKGHFRWYVTAGLLVTAVSTYMMEQANLSVDFRYMLISRVIGMMSIPLIMLPATVASYAFLPKDKSDAVSGLTNLARNLGGSVGIAVLNVILARRAQYHQSVLVSHMTPFDPHYTSTLAATAHSLGASAGAANAPAVAQGLLYAQVQQQGAFLSYIDAFHFMTVICIVVIPLALLLRSPKNTVKADIAIH